MGTEIERKYLLSSDDWRGAVSASIDIVQGYLSLDPERTVRIRLKDGAGRLTIKGRSHGAARAEFEYDVPADDARELLGLCVGPPIEKTRHLVHVGDLTWEIDVFRGANEGLIVAEVELDDPDAAPPLPSWVGEEVTDDPRYYNARLVERPFTAWA